MMHEYYMRRCFELSQRAKGHTSPNPMVGAVLVHDGRIIGEGWHEQYGKAHAEVNCLESVLPADKALIPDSTMYVSLEPCAHYGKTPPCALRLVQERVKEVIIANTDPFEKVSGNGISILKEAGAIVQTGLLENEGLWLNRRFFCFHRQRRPYIILKWAQSAEGFIAPADRSRMQLSNHFSSMLTHRWRTEEAAILVGYNTALNDNPQLTARQWPGPQPLRIVIDRQCRLPHTLHLFNQEVPTWIINSEKDKTEGNLHYIRLPFDHTLLPALLERLHAASKLSLIVEGGAALLESFVREGLWDEARIFKTPVSIKTGIHAPILTESHLNTEITLACDRLQVYTRTSGQYPYVPGMEL